MFVVILSTDCLSKVFKSENNSITAHNSYSKQLQRLARTPKAMEQHLVQLYETIYAASTLPATVTEANAIGLLAPLVRAAYESKTESSDPTIEVALNRAGEQFLRSLHEKRIDENIEFLQFQRQFAIRSILHNYYECEQSDMTLAKLFEYLKPQWTHKPLTLDWLRKILARLGFSIIVTGQKSERVIEMHSQKLARLKYIRRIQSRRQEKRNIIYFREVTICLQRRKDETTAGDTDGTDDAKATADEEITVVFAANQTGLLNFAFLEMTGKTTDNFIEWLTIISENQAANSVLVIEPKAFSVMTKPTLFSASTLPSSFKYERLWRNYNQFIPNADKIITDDVHSIEMLDFCWRHRDLMTMLRKPTVDYAKILQDNGYEVIQLPCLHPELTPMQRIDFVAMINGIEETHRSIEAIRCVIRTKLDGSTVDEWQGYFADVERVEGDFLRFEALLSEGDEVIEMDDSSDDVEFVDECRETLCLSDDDNGDDEN